MPTRQQLGYVSGCTDLVARPSSVQKVAVCIDSVAFRSSFPSHIAAMIVLFTDASCTLTFGGTDTVDEPLLCSSLCDTHFFVSHILQKKGALIEHFNINLQFFL